MTQYDTIIRLIETLRFEAESFSIATVIRTANATSAKAGAKAVITSSGEMTGYVGGGCVTSAVKKVALAAISCGEPRLIRIKPQEEVAADAAADSDGTELFKSACPSGGTVDVFIEPVQAPARVVICGASPVAQALVTITKAMGMRTILAADVADHDKVSQADEYHDGFDFASLELQARDSVVVVTQGKKDRAALVAALNSAAAYVGMVGSRRKMIKLKEQIADIIAPARCDALHGPAGLDIGAIAPEEIALSIVSEMVAFRRNKHMIQL